MTILMPTSKCDHQCDILRKSQVGISIAIQCELGPLHNALVNIKIVTCAQSRIYLFVF